MEALPYYKWFWQDYRANRRVQRMPWQARGLYRELLDEFWAEGSLPSAHAELADICGASLEEFDLWWPHMAACWEERDGRIYNHKMDQQRTATDTARVAMSKGGKAGGTVSNSSTRDKAKQAYPKPTLSLPVTQPDIEEKRREEKTSGLDQPFEATPSMIASGVLETLCLSGKDLRNVLEDIARSEQKAGRNADDIRDSMIAAWQAYDLTRAKLGSFAKGAQKFFGEGHWKSPPKVAKPATAHVFELYPGQLEELKAK